ncbi:MAG: ATP F0F1 synthase subunit B [Caulobacteraceae bacterium]|nr:ATP F0F1 synthase subunit B [Caulobacteraceae bacterium]
MFNLEEPEFWVAVGLVILIGILIKAKAPGLAAQALDARGIKIQAELDEALRLRQEAQDLLAAIKTQREEAEHLAAEMMASAQAEATRFAAEAKVKLEEQIKRRQALAERKIALAQSQAEAEVKAAAGELAAQIAESVLAARVAGLKSDPLIDLAVEKMGDKLQ